MMFDRYFLNCCTKGNLLRIRLLGFEPAIKTGTTPPRQHAHSFHAHSALQRGHYFGDVVVDSKPPPLSCLRRRSSTLCKAPLKKLASSVLSARASFRSIFFFCNSLYAGEPGEGVRFGCFFGLVPSTSYFHS